MGNLIDILKSCVSDPRLGQVSVQALRMIEQSAVTKQHTVSGKESSTTPGNIWKSKRDIGNIRREAFIGIDETIASLTEQEVAVRFGSIETELGIIAIWFTDEPDRVVGIIVGTYSST